MQTNESKAKRIEELEAELAELRKSSLPPKLRIAGENKAVVKTTILSDPQSVVSFIARGKKHLVVRSKNVPVIEYTD